MLPEPPNVSYWLASPQFQNICRRALNDDAWNWALPQLQWMGERAATEVATLAQIADKESPKLITHDARGNRISRIDYHPAYERMKEIAYGSGSVLPTANNQQPTSNNLQRFSAAVVTPAEPKEKQPMSKRSLVIIASVLAAVVLVAVPFVYAQGFHRMHRRSGDFMMFGNLDRVKDALELSDAQVDEIRSIGKALHEQNAPYREQLRGGYQAIAQALLANPNDLTAAQRMIDQQTNAERTIKQNMLAAASKALNVLTPEQRQKAAQFVSERASRMQR